MNVARVRFSRKRRRGFALLVTITLLAFLVMLLVSLASLTRVETRVAANSRQLAQARQHALLGLNMALGRLQELAGPDQRITGTADLVDGRHDGKQHWTGVWNSDSTPGNTRYGKNIGWLVSGVPDGDDVDVSDGVAAVTGGTLVTLLDEKTVGTSNTGDKVTVSTEPIKSSGIPGTPGEQVIGQFAYWVGDEGVKANVALIDPWADGGDAAQKRHSFVNMQRSGVERVVAEGTTAIDFAYPVNHSQLENLISMRQLPLLSSGDATTLATAALNRYHDLTAVSHSLLTDVSKGGLKKDLSNWSLYGAPSSAIEQDTNPIITTGEGADSGLPQWGLLRSFLTTRHNAAALPPLEQTRTQHGLTPVVTYVRMGFNISAKPDEAMKVHLFPTVVLWNPHNVPLSHVDAAGDPVVYQLFWNISAGRTLRFAPVDAPAKLTTVALNTPFIFDIELSAPIPPGQSLVFTVKDIDGEDPVYDPSGGTALVNKAFDGASAVINGAHVLTEADLASGIPWSVNNTGGDTMSFGLRRKSTSAIVADGSTAGEYFVVRRVGFGNFGGSGTVVSQAALADEVIGPRFVFTMLARMAGSTSGSTFRWIANQNYLSRFSPRSTEEGSNHTIYFGSVSSFAATSAPLSFGDSGLRASAGTTIPNGNANELILREILPDNAVVTSLAQLQPANASLLTQYPLYAIGNSLASPYIPLDKTEVAAAGIANHSKLYDVSWLLNRDLWDRYYFSTVTDSLDAADIDDPAFRFPNARHRLIGQPDIDRLKGSSAFDTAAAHLHVRGGFNVNSTSAHAWHALLAGHRGLESNGNFRHPMSRFITPVGTVNAGLEGYRNLSDAQIEELAKSIRAEVRNRGPFFSLADFVNRRLVARGRDTSDVQRLKGTIQAAIDNLDTAGGSPVINTATEFTSAFASLASSAHAGTSNPSYQGHTSPKAPVSSRLAFAPGYLTQADVLTAIGPALTARSDTFVIRAYGEARNPVTGASEGKAWCEAIVQRTPAYVEDSAEPTVAPLAGSASERFGRRFKITSFRWLSQNEL